MITLELQCFYHLDYNKLDTLGQKYFPKFEFVADEELNNGSFKKYWDVNKEEYDELDQYDKSAILRALTDGEPLRWRSDLVLLYLVHMDEIPEGNYLIEVSW